MNSLGGRWSKGIVALVSAGSALLLLSLPALAKMPLGHLDEAQPTWVGGWAFDPDHPEAEIAIHIYVDGQFAGNGETKGYRPDVNAAYGITGNHGFTFPVDIAKFGPGTHNVCAYGIDLDGEGNPAFDPCPFKVTIACNPQCGGKNCGGDGCGGSCGSCPGGQTCNNGVCSGGQPPGGMPTGNLDAANEGMIGGWAKDPDWEGPLNVHIYADGALIKVLKADQWREDVGAHAFSWDPPPFGAGDHEVIAYALGVDGAGNPNGENPGLKGSPKTLKGTCNGLESDALGWCQGMAPYWVNRLKDTVWVGNDSIRVGVNKSFGGTLFGLYSAGWDRNLILEHGGGAVQLSIWGYDPVGGAGWYGNDGCDPKWYTSEAACKAGGHASCSLWAYPGGAHCSNCTSQKPCGGWTPGAPWNPIQAQGPDCGWNSPANDCNVAEWQGQTFYTRLNAPFHFTSTAPPAPMPMEQWVTAHDGYAEVKYRLTYSGPSAWCNHPQEIPAIFTSFGMNQHYYYYDGEAPFTGAGVVHKAGASNGVLRYPNRPEYGHGNDYFGYVREGWWGVCDGPQERCLTVASFSPVMNEVAMGQNQTAGSGYITALGWFGVSPGMDLQWTVYYFPYRYDQVVGGKSVRDIIYSLAPPEFKTPTCTPSCGGKQCGSDGCGGSCGNCPGGFVCDGNGQCVSGCPDSCWGKQCGPDGCGGSCGNCAPGFTCTDAGQCTQECFGSCMGKECGTDGCGASCGACNPGLTCTDGGQCVQNCVGDCTGKECGSDGCGVSCGNCGPGLFCTDAGQCVDECPASCVGKECGSDGCGGDCGNCGPGLVCFVGVCVEPCEPTCDGKECGPDGCGGICGTCGFGEACAMSDYQCLPEEQVPPEERWEPEEEGDPDVVSQGDGGSGADTAGPGEPDSHGSAPDGQPNPVPDENGTCPDGFKAVDGKCILAEENKKNPGGCGVVDGSPPARCFLALVFLLAGVWFARRRHLAS